MSPTMKKDSQSSGNWRSLQKRLRATSTSSAQPRKRHKKQSDDTPSASTSSNIAPNGSPSPVGNPVLHGNTVESLRSLIFSPNPFSPDLPAKDRQPGPYIALDCEMVGVGPTGKESTLARVSVVNYFGAVLMDEFVQQKERVTDWRTQWSGVRARDMINAKTFEEVQGVVAELMNDRILVGHAVQNDLKALMLSHPWAQRRDTQVLAHRHGQSRSARPALRILVHDMLGVKIQGGEHSSVTDARATMAIYRLNRGQWDKGYAAVPIRVQRNAKAKAQLKASREPKSIEPEGVARRRTEASPPSKTQSKGVSSGLSTIVRRPTKGKGGTDGTKVKWWANLAGTGDSSKGRISITA
ncbi:Ribonuclease H-like domain containing protein [Russula decolorans]